MQFNLVSSSEEIRSLIKKYASKKVPDAIAGNGDDVKQDFALYIHTIDVINASISENLGDQRVVSDYKIPAKFYDLVMPESVKLVNTNGTPDVIVRPSLSKTVKFSDKAFNLYPLSPVEFNAISSAIADNIGCEISVINRSVQLLSEVVEGKFAIIAESGAINGSEEGMPIVVSELVKPFVDKFRIVSGLSYKEQIRKHILYKLTSKTMEKQ
jgi:hypothetical protein